MNGVRKIQNPIRQMRNSLQYYCSATAGIWSKPFGSDVFSGNDFNTYNYNMDEILVNLLHWMVGDDCPSIEN